MVIGRDLVNYYPFTVCQPEMKRVEQGNAKKIGSFFSKKEKKIREQLLEIIERWRSPKIFIGDSANCDSPVLGEKNMMCSNLEHRPLLPGPVKRLQMLSKKL